MREHLYTAIQGFVAGGIVMAYVCNYHTGQLWILTLFLCLIILARLYSL